MIEKKEETGFSIDTFEEMSQKELLKSVKSINTDINPLRMMIAPLLKTKAVKIAISLILIQLALDGYMVYLFINYLLR